MVIAVFGDIHGNIEALKTAYDAVISLKVDKIYHLGDLGGYAPFVNEVIDFLIEHQIEGVQGNYDFNVANDSEHCGCKYEDPAQGEFAQKSFEWTKAHTSPASKEYMKNLPQEISFSSNGKKVHPHTKSTNSGNSSVSNNFENSTSRNSLSNSKFGVGIKLFHATPHKNNLYWYEERSDKFFLEMAEKTDADLMIYGHTHKPYRKDIQGKVFINAVSVGKPKDGNPRACVAIINITDKDIKSNFVRLPYDIEKVAQAIRESGLPAYFANKLKEAR